MVFSNFENLPRPIWSLYANEQFIVKLVRKTRALFPPSKPNHNGVFFIILAYDPTFGKSSTQPLLCQGPLVQVSALLDTVCPIQKIARLIKPKCWTFPTKCNCNLKPNYVP